VGVRLFDQSAHDAILVEPHLQSKLRGYRVRLVNAVKVKGSGKRSTFVVNLHGLTVEGIEEIDIGVVVELILNVGVAGLEVNGLGDAGLEGSAEG
jgi:hypothetical protein